jgi:hypothetical protein
MRKLSIFVTVLVGSLFLAGPAVAQSLKERKEIKKGEAHLKEDPIPRTNKECGSKLDAKVNWKSFVGKTKGSYSFMSAAYYCANVFGGIRYVCSDADGKEAVKASIKTVECSFDPGATKDKLKRYGPTLSLKNKVLKAGYNWDTGNIDSATKEWLLNNL